MKKISFNPLTFLTIFLISFLGSGFIIDDSCNSYFPMKEGTKFELSYFNAKDKFQGKTEYEITEKTEEGSKIIATVHIISYDKKEKSVLESDYNVSCEDGMLEIDIRGILNAAQMQQMSTMKDMDVTVETENIHFPSDLDVGDQLDDGSLEMKVSSSAGGMNILSFKTEITDRKVIGKESITTPAGNFNCIILTSNIQSKAGFANFSFETKDWIAKNVGVVRSETYRKGSLDSYTHLTKFE